MTILRRLVRLLTNPRDGGASRRLSCKVDWKGCDVHRLMISFWSSVGYVGLGTTLLTFSSTILDLGQQVGASLAALSAMFVCRAVGGAVGTITAGVVFDKLHRFSYTLLSGAILSMMVVSVMLSYSVNIYMLGVLMLLHGGTHGLFDGGTHVVLLRLWKEKSGPSMQVLHFSYAFGAFLAPMITRQFIAEDLRNDEEDGNATFCVGSHPEMQGSGMMDLVNSTTGDSSRRFQIAYYINSAVLIPSLIAFIFFAVKYNLIGCCRKKTEVIVNPTYDDTEPLTEEEEDNETEPNDGSSNGGQSLEFGDEKNKKSSESQTSDSKKQTAPPTRQPLLYKIVVVSLLFAFRFIYVGLEVTYGNWIFTVAVKGSLNYCKPEATQIQSLFWGLFAFGRLFSVALALLRVRSSVMMTGNVSGSMVAAVIMVSAPHSVPAIWLASAVLGLSYASIYPTTIVWMSEHIDASGITTGIVISAGILGVVSVPAIVGALIAKISPDVLFYATFVGMTISATLMTIMLVVAHCWKRRVHKRTPDRSLHECNGVHELDELKADDENEDCKSIDED